METDGGSLSDRNTNTQASISLNPSSLLMTCLEYEHNRDHLRKTTKDDDVWKVCFFWGGRGLMPALHGEFPSAFTVNFDISLYSGDVLSEIYLTGLRKQSNYVTWGLEMRTEEL